MYLTQTFYWPLNLISFLYFSSLFCPQEFEKNDIGAGSAALHINGIEVSEENMDAFKYVTTLSNLFLDPSLSKGVH